MATTHGITRLDPAPDPAAAGYAWVITKDPGDDDGFNAELHLSSRVGVMGPSNADERLCAAVQTPGAHRVKFRMYFDRDSDDEKHGELAYAGFFTHDPEHCEYIEPYVGPLVDFGAPDAGAAIIYYDGHPDWNCG